MRGRKADSVFIGNFIVDCANKGKATPEDIIKEAKNQINIIDEKIKEVERIRLTRSKYLDVIDALEKSEKSDKVDEIKVLNFFKLQHPDICRNICRTIQKNNSASIEEVRGNYPELDILFCVKQLIENKILVKQGKTFSKGEVFLDYLRFINHEV